MLGERGAGAACGEKPQQPGQDRGTKALWLCSTLAMSANPLGSVNFWGWESELICFSMALTW